MARKESKKRFSSAPASPAAANKKITAIEPLAAEKGTVNAQATPAVATTPVVSDVPVTLIVSPAAPKVAVEAVVSAKESSAPESGSAITALLADLASDNPAVRVRAAEALGGLGARSAVPALIATLNSVDADLAREAAAALGLLGDASAVEPLIDVLNNFDGFHHGVVRAAAASSLARLQDSRAVEPLLNAVRDTMAEASAEAVRALAELGDARAVPGLIEVVHNFSGYFLPVVRRAAILALGQLGGADAEAQIRATASDESEDFVVRQTAQQASR